MICVDKRGSKDFTSIKESFMQTREWPKTLKNHSCKESGQGLYLYWRMICANKRVSKDLTFIKRIICVDKNVSKEFTLIEEWFV